MNLMFYYCISLSSLPDISKLDTSNVKYINNAFELSECYNIISSEIIYLYIKLVE